MSSNGASQKPKVYVGDTTRGLSDELERGLAHVDWEEIVPSGARVAVKPNYCWPELLPGVTTSSAALDAVLGALSARAGTLAVVESDGISFAAEQAFAAHGTADICAKYGAKLVNLSRERSVRRRTHVAGQIVEFELPALLLEEIDVFVTLPVLKTHVIAGVSLGMKNLWGCLPDSMRVLQHHVLTPGIVALSMELKPRLSIIDASYGLDKRGPVFGDPIPANRVIVAGNVVAGDAIGCRLLGFDPADTDHLRLAAEAGMGPLVEAAMDVAGERAPIGHGFSVQPTIVDRISNATYRLAAVTRLIHGSPLSKPIYAITRRTLPVPNRDRRPVVG
jgi:uncharacterized protein (DUF362 family)